MNLPNKALGISPNFSDSKRDIEWLKSQKWFVDTLSNNLGIGTKRKSPLENPEILKLLQVLCNAREYSLMMFQTEELI